LITLLALAIKLGRLGSLPVMPLGRAPLGQRVYGERDLIGTRRQNFYEL
jgi:hypothetical protein